MSSINWPVNFTGIKYGRWYYHLIKKAQLRGEVKGYKESHHIIPRSFGGDNLKSNLVQLTAREHYIAHALLWKMQFEGLYGSKMAFAFNTFINKMTTKDRGVHHTYTISSRVYEKFRKHYSEILKEKYAREGGTWVGRKHTEESKRLIGEKSKLKQFKFGPKNPQWGKKQNLSAEGKARRVAAIKERWNNPEFKEMMLQKRKEFLQTPKGIAQRKANGERLKGVKRNPAHVEKTASKKRGKKAHEIFSPQALINMEEGRKNRVLSDEAKEKIRQGLLRGCKMPKSADWKRQMSERMTGITRATKTCEHCGKIAVLSNHNRWHGSNCKILKL
jgi:ribosomal protein S27AE